MPSENNSARDLFPPEPAMGDWHADADLDAPPAVLPVGEEEK